MSVHTEVEKLDECTTQMKVEVDVEETREELLATAKAIAKQAKLPGFRKGKVPLEVARRVFAKEIREETLETLVNRAFRTAIEESGLQPVRPGNVSDLVFDGEGPLTFTARIEVEPEFELGDYKSVKVEVKEAEVTDEELEKELQAMREAHATLEALDREKGEDGDIALCDFIQLPREEGDEPKIEEKVFFEVGAGGKFDELNEALRSTPVGETTEFSFTYPESHPNEEFRGQEVRFKVKVKALKERILPELDDELAQQVTEGAEGLEELKGRIQAAMKVHKEVETRREAREDALNQLLAMHPFEVPATLVEERARQALGAVAAQIERQGMDPGRMEVDWDKELAGQREGARRGVRAHFLLKKIGEAEGIQVSDAEVEAEIAQAAEARGQAPEKLRAMMEKDGSRDALAESLYRRRILDFIIGDATI